MFGLFKNRKQYNGTIDTKLNNEYQIRTRDNDHFPGVVAYLNLIDIAWNTKLNEDEGALYIASAYCRGLMENGLEDEASVIASRIAAVTSFGVERGLIDIDKAALILARLNGE